mmetsp:Transcript_11779/g.27295  ORF Transcript_11779/g.27295 Transcript_11779/m.27295 type:complete len:233 (+) Transcript_11779:1646-2344(+)
MLSLEPQDLRVYLSPVPGLLSRERRKLELERWVEEVEEKKRAFENLVDSAVEKLRREIKADTDRIGTETTKLNQDLAARVAQLKAETKTKIARLEKKKSQASGRTTKAIDLMLAERVDWSKSVEDQMAHSKEQIEDLANRLDSFVDPDAAKTSKKEPPSQIICPIMLGIMADPVMAADGCTYERAAIQHVFDATPIWRAPRSPATGADLRNRTLIENITIRSLACEHSAGQK